MSEGGSTKYGCRCGETVFDLSGHATGDVLTCPFCKRQYFFWGASQIELLDEPIDTSSPNAYRPDAPAKSLPVVGELKKDAPSEKKLDEPARAHADMPAAASADDREHKRRRFYEIQKAEAPERPAAPKPAAQDAALRGGVGAMPPAEKSKRLFFLPDTSKPVPGGFMPMIACILGGNAIAFVCLAVWLPADPDGTRVAPWGLIPKSAIWPELAAIVVGHLIGFTVWAVFVSIWLRKQRERSKAAGSS